MRKKLAAALSAVMLLGAWNPGASVAYAEDNIAYTADGGEELRRACEADEAIAYTEDDIEITDEQLEVFNLFSDTLEYYKEVSEEGKFYPDYVAGVYGDEDGNIVVAVTGDVDAARNELLEHVEHADQLVFVEKEHSYAELQELQEQIKEQTIDLYENGTESEQEAAEHVTGMRIDEEENEVIVETDTLSKTDEMILTEEFTDDVLIVESEVEPCATQLRPGCCITSLTGNCSMGCRAWRMLSTGKVEYGFITCGHEMRIGDKVYYGDIKNMSASTYLGKVTEHGYEKRLWLNNLYDSKVDASFVALENKNYTLSNKTMYVSAELTSRAYIDSDYYNLGCVMIGAKSAEFKTGKVINDSCRMSIRDEYWNDTIKEDPKTVSFQDVLEVKLNFGDEVLGGDSGGLLFAKRDGKFAVVGIVSAGIGEEYYNETNKSLGYFAKYKNILSEMDVNIY